MAHGVEIRAPLMDWRLVTYCFNLNNTDKIANGYSKRILRDAVNGVVVDEIRKRKTKIGFVSPLENWLLGSLKEYLLDNNVSESEIKNLHSPIGLDLNAITPEQIALSIISEIVMLENRATGKQMKDK